MDQDLKSTLASLSTQDLERVRQYVCALIENKKKIEHLNNLLANAKP